MIRKRMRLTENSTATAISRWLDNIQLALLTSIACGFIVPEAVADSPVLAVVPERWTPPREHQGNIDFALSSQADAWMRHVAIGDPSFDNFKHRASNPIVRGKAPFNWPVNGCLFEDPKSGNWYAYVGHYLLGYGLGPQLPFTHSRVHRSKDRGENWEALEPVFDDPKFCFHGDVQCATLAPDVSVVFADNRYHLAYDWLTDNSTWDKAHHPNEGVDSGIAYAWAERPEGPFHRAAQPILRMSEIPKRFNRGEKYCRAYGASIVRRKNDWLVLALIDSDQFFGWGLIAMTAVDPEGAWSNPVMVLGVEGDSFFPPTMESYPMMTHDGYVYASNSSVALNRDFQAIYRVKIEEAHRPEAWQLFQHGTAWHGEPVVNEGLGIWGQTYSGFVDRDGQLQILFPSRERETDLGTINLATRPWAQPLRERSFDLSGHQGRSLALLRYVWKQFHLKAELAIHSGTARIVWGYQAPLGPDRHASDATIHPLSLNDHLGLELTAAAWKIVSVDAAGKYSILADGSLETGTARTVEIETREDGQTHLAIDGTVRWDGSLPAKQGPLGLLVDPFTFVKVSKFEIDGPFEPAVLPWLYSEALTGAGVNMEDWEVIRSPLYRYGTGALRKTAGGRVKWNYRGRGFQLWSPQGPEFGRYELLLDGRKLAEIDCHAEREQPSKIVYTCDDAGDGYHAVVLRSLEGRMVVDSLDALN